MAHMIEISTESIVTNPPSALILEATRTVPDPVISGTFVFSVEGVDLQPTPTTPIKDWESYIAKCEANGVVPASKKSLVVRYPMGRSRYFFVEETPNYSYGPLNSVPESLINKTRSLQLKGGKDHVLLYRFGIIGGSTQDYEVFREPEGEYEMLIDNGYQPRAGELYFFTEYVDNTPGSYCIAKESHIKIDSEGSAPPSSLSLVVSRRTTFQDANKLRRWFYEVCKRHNKTPQELQEFQPPYYVARSLEPIRADEY